MDAIILAAGEGARLKGWTSDKPKGMMTLGNAPILEHIVRGLASSGIQEINMVVGYRKNIVMSYFGEGNKFGVKINYIDHLLDLNKIRIDSPYSSFAYYRDLLKMYKIKFLSKKFYFKTYLNLFRFYLHTLDKYPNITSKELKIRKNYFFILIAYLIYIFDKIIYKKT